MIWFILVLEIFAVVSLTWTLCRPRSSTAIYVPEIPDHLLMEYQVEEKARRSQPKVPAITDPAPTEIVLPTSVQYHPGLRAVDMVKAIEQLKFEGLTGNHEPYPLMHRYDERMKQNKIDEQEATKVSYKDFKDYPINSIVSGEELEYWQAQQADRSALMVQSITDAKPHPMGIEIEWKPRQKAGITQRR